MTIFGILFLIFIIYLIWRMWPLITAIYKAKKMHDQAQQQYEEELKQREKARRTEDPEQSSVDRIHEANLDLDGGEYVEYEEIEKS